MKTLQRAIDGVYSNQYMPRVPPKDEPSWISEWAEGYIQTRVINETLRRDLEGEFGVTDYRFSKDIRDAIWILASEKNPGFRTERLICGMQGWAEVVARAYPQIVDVYAYHQNIRQAPVAGQQGEP